MDPIMDIRRVRSDRFTYSLGAAGHATYPREEYFDSLELSLGDAARSLLHYFDRVQVCLEGASIGSFAVPRLLHEAPGIAGGLQARLGHLS